MIREELEDIIKTAIKNRSTDIHFTETENDQVLIRMRSGNVMIPLQTIERKDYEQLLAYTRFNAAMDLAHPMQPQSGGLILDDKSSQLTCRVSILPTAKFQSMILRVINYKPTFTLDELPFFPENAQELKEIAQIPAGLVLLGGPTESGKTTTAYAMIDYLKNELGKSVITIEDPIEYHQPVVEPLQHTETESSPRFQERVNAKQLIDPDRKVSSKANKNTGMNYEVGIKEILRHDPDVIVIGEIRDETTARNAMRAALSGHLVISTIHARDNLGNIHRLLDYGIRVDDMAQGVVALVNQRLLPAGTDKKAIMEIAEGSSLEKMMDQISDGVVSNLTYQTIDEAFYKWKYARDIETSTKQSDGYIEIKSEHDRLDDGISTISVGKKTSQAIDLE